MINPAPKTIRIAGADAAPLTDTDAVELSCGTDGCAANCCTHGPHIILHPYEIALICSAAGLSYEDLLDVVETDRVNGFPLVMLPREPRCHFWTGQGCRIHAARPLACRLFPLGRVHEDGRSSLVLPDRNRCAGLAAAPRKTVGEYLRRQDTAVQIAMHDAWIDFVKDVERLDLPDAPVTSVAFHLLVYSPDTPPSRDPLDPSAPVEQRFLLRLETARRMLPRFLLSRRL